MPINPNQQLSVKQDQKRLQAMRKKFIFIALTFLYSLAFSQIDRAGNVISDGVDSSLGGLAILFTIICLLVMHYGGEDKLFKMLGYAFAAAIGIGILKVIF